jgi:hypothetical protein
MYGRREKGIKVSQAMNLKAFLERKNHEYRKELGRRAGLANKGRRYLLKKIEATYQLK